MLPLGGNKELEKWFSYTNTQKAEMGFNQLFSRVKKYLWIGSKNIWVSSLFISGQKYARVGSQPISISKGIWRFGKLQGDKHEIWGPDQKPAGWQQFRLEMGSGLKILTQVGSNFCSSGWVESAIFDLHLDLEISPKNVKFFNIFPFESKSTWILFTAGQSMLGLGQVKAHL